VSADRRLVADRKLAPDGKPSSFDGDLGAPESGRYRLLVAANNAATGNTGVAELPVAYAGPPKMDQGERRR